MILQIEYADGRFAFVTVDDLVQACREVESLGDFDGQWLVIDDVEYGQEAIMFSENYVSIEI
jgi:hypothetical protein